MNFTRIGFFHWIHQRFFALLIPISLIWIYIWNLPLLNGLLLVWVVSHFKYGIETLIEDYIHTKQFKLLGFTILRLVLLFLFQSIFILILF